MTTSIKKIAFLSGVLLTLFGAIQASAVTVGDVAPAGEATQCIDLKYNLIITARDKATNGEVTLLQEFLQQNGFLAADPTGYFGAQTKAAVMKFQKSVDLIDSGYVATYTRAAIKKATCGATSPGATSSTKVCAYEGVVFGGSAPCTSAIEGSTANGSKCSCTTVSGATQGSGSQSASSGSKTSLAKVTVSNSLSGPWSPSGSAVCNVGKVHIQASNLSRSSGAKGCIAPSGSTCTPRDFYNDEWVSESTMIATMSPGDFPNGSYDTYLSYPGEPMTKVGSLTLKSCASTKVCAYEGVVFGGSAPCTSAIEGSTANGSKCSCTLAPVIPTANTGSEAKVCAYEGAVFGGSPACTEATEGQNNGSRCTCKTAGSSAASQTTSQAQASASSGGSSATLPPNFPYTFINDSTASNNIVARIKLTLKGTTSKPLGTSLKGCTKPVGSTGCVLESEFSLVKSLPGWAYNSQTDTYSIDRDVSKEFLPNVEYASYIRVFDGSRYEVKWKAKTPSTTSATTNSQTAQSTGAVFGAGSQGVPYSQPVTYSWVVYAGSMLGQQSASNLGWSEPATPCTASNAGATYYLGTSSSGSQVVAVCNPSNQGVTSFSTVDSSTVNAPAQNAVTQSAQVQSTTAQTAIPARVPTYARGMFTNENNQQVEWACGDADAGPPADATGWVAQGSGCFHRIVQ